MRESRSWGSAGACAASAVSYAAPCVTGTACAARIWHTAAGGRRSIHFQQAEKRMKNLLVVALALGIAAPPKAGAAETKPVLQLAPKPALAAAPAHSYAPFVVPAPEPELDLAPR